MDFKARGPFADVQRLLKWMPVLMIMAVAAFLMLAPLTFLVLPFWGWDDVTHSFEAWWEQEGTTTKESRVGLAMLAGFALWCVALVLVALLLDRAPKWTDKWTRKWTRK